MAADTDDLEPLTDHAGDGHALLGDLALSVHGHEAGPAEVDLAVGHPWWRTSQHLSLHSLRDGGGRTQFAPF